ncbi:hypothetical protein BKA82DRAFT_4015900 [Pisolithus tinctorius]|nr:hypothetical protein BKA82DRAFT_4015900 [Pisolithus tinctorius]
MQKFVTVHNSIMRARSQESKRNDCKTHGTREIISWRRERGDPRTATAGATNMKLWDVVEDSQEIREKEETRQSDHPILSYKPNRFKTLQTQKWEHLGNERVELDEQGHPGNKSNDPGIDREPSSSSTSLQKGEKCVGETSEIWPKMMGVTLGKRTSGSQPQDNG